MESNEPELQVQPIVDWLTGGAKPASDTKGGCAFCASGCANADFARIASRFCQAVAPERRRTSVLLAGRQRRHRSERWGHAFMASDEALTSPLRVVYDTRQEIRMRLSGAGHPDEFSGAERAT